ncbi:MAG TPA: hypothetical protein VMN60_00065 [Longimicrobiales bacterium]|nr:hypothetical protein [Longimicrobiales bacterium]
MKRTERCLECGAAFRRGLKATIITRTTDGREETRPAAAWLEQLGPVRVPEPGPDGRMVGPERVRVRSTVGQKPFYYGRAFLGWIETYTPTRTGTMDVRADGLLFLPDRGPVEHWPIASITGLQPASATVQLGFRDHMTSIRFLEGSVRLWTRVLSAVLHEHWGRQGYHVLELQPHIRTCRVATSAT